MRLLVIGTLPPPSGRAAGRLAAVTAERRGAGDDVTMLSPDRRSAAHLHARLDGLRLAFHLARLARRFDAVVIDCAPGLPLSTTADRLTRGVTLAAIGESLRGYGEVTLRLPSPIPFPGGVGGRATAGLWARATHVVVENDEDRDRVLAAPGVVAERVVIVAPDEPVRGEREPRWSDVAPDATDLRPRIQALVRERAARDREVNAARAALGANVTLDRAGDPFLGAGGGETPTSAAALARVVANKARREFTRRVAPRS